MTEVLLSIFYFLIFFLIIKKLKFFEIEGIKKKYLYLIFLIKTVAGIVIYYIYTYHYTDRSTADIYKYFDDSKYIYDALFINPKHYLQLVLGINSDADYLKVYTENTKNWFEQTDAFYKVTNTQNLDLFNSGRLLTRINAFFRIFSFGYLFVHCLFMIFISFIGQVAIYKTFIKFFKKRKYELMIGIFLIPSILLWSSSVLKESIIFFALGFFIFYFIKIINGEKKNKYFIAVLIYFLLILITKYYIAVALIPAAISAYIISITNNKKILLKYFGINIILFVIAINIKLILPFDVLNLLSNKQSDMIRISKGGICVAVSEPKHNDTIFIESKDELKVKTIDTINNQLEIEDGLICKRYRNGKETNELVQIKNDSARYILLYKFPKAGSFIETNKLEPNLVSVIKNLPSALINVFLRPFITEADSLFILIAALENILLIFFFFFSFFIFKNKGILKNNIILFCLNFSIILNIIIGLISPVLGSIVRFRIFSLLFIIISCLMIFDKDKFLRIIKYKFIKR